MAEQAIAGHASAPPAAAVPAFNRGFRLRHDPVRDAWMVLAPERLLMLDGTGVEVLKLVDGTRSVPDIVAALALRFDAPHEVIARDVEALLHDLAEQGAIRL